MKILFTKSDSLFSKLIRSVTKEPVSHCAVVINTYAIHFNLLGLQIEKEELFRQQCQVLFELERPDPTKPLLEMLEGNGFKGYDYTGMLYLGLKYLFPFLPKKNLWDETGMNFCSEWVEECLDTNRDEMLSPYRLYLMLSQDTHKGE